MRFVASAVLSAGLIVATSAMAEDAQPAIDLSVPAETNSNIVEEEYQSVRPGSQDRRFNSQSNTGGTTFYGSYDDPTENVDEYGVQRSQRAIPGTPGSTTGEDGERALESMSLE